MLIEDLTQKVIEFRDARDWKKFHNPKDSSLSLVLEASELLEHFQWKNGDELDEYVKNNKDKISEELADILYWILLISNDLNIDISKAFLDKLAKNDLKYPVEKSKGNSLKYDQL